MTIGNTPDPEHAVLKPSPMPSGSGSRRMSLAAATILLFVLVAAFGPWLVPYDALAIRTGDRLLPPGSVLSDGTLSVFGTDQIGRDLLAQILQGTRISIMVGAATLTLAGVIGTLVGIVAGFFGGRIDNGLMRLADIQLAFPGILFAIFIAALLGPSVVNVIIVLSLAGWVVFARVARGQTIAVKKREFVDASRSLGASPWHLLTRCILPACRAPFIVIATVEFGAVIVAEASLSFLGLGTPATTPSWGVTIANGRDYLLAGAWWIATIPGVFLALLAIAFGTLGDAVRDRFDPRMRIGR